MSRDSRAGRAWANGGWASTLALLTALALSFAGQATQPRSNYELSVSVDDRGSPDLVLTLFLDSSSTTGNPSTGAERIDVNVTLGPELEPRGIETGACGVAQGLGFCSAAKAQVIGDTWFNVTARIANRTLARIAENPGAPVFANVTVVVVYTDNAGNRPRTIQQSLTFPLNHRPPTALDLASAALAGLGGAGVVGLSVYVSRRVKIEELYLIHESGMLIRHWARGIESLHDTDIMSGMFIVLQEFVRDSFADRENALEHLRFGKAQVVMVRGENTWLAAVVRGRYLDGLPRKLRDAIVDFEAFYGDVLRNWNGDVDRFPGADIVALRFMKGPSPGTAS